MDILSASFRELMSAPLREQAAALAAQMAKEDGVGSALTHFLASLPRHDLLCDASLLLNPPEHKLALYRLRRRHAQLALQFVFGVATGLGIVAGSQCTDKTGLDGVLGFSRDLVDPTHWFYRSPGFWFRALVCGWSAWIMPSLMRRPAACGPHRRAGHRFRFRPAGSSR